MTATPGFRRKCEKETMEVFDRLRSQLSKWLDSRALARYEKSLQDTILEPAIAIHRTIRCSGKKYRFDYDAHVENPVSVESMKSDIIDVEPFTSSKKKDLKGVFGCFMPSLIVEIAFGQRDTPLVPAVLLGYNSDDLNPFDPGRHFSAAHETYGGGQELRNESRYSEPASTLSYDTRPTISKPSRTDALLSYFSGKLGAAPGSEDKKSTPTSPLDAPRRKSVSRSQTHPSKARSKKPSSHKSASADTSEHDERLAASSGYDQPRRARTYGHTRVSDEEDVDDYSEREEGYRP